jgi:hypothetical protein
MTDADNGSDHDRVLGLIKALADANIINLDVSIGTVSESVSSVLKSRAAPEALHIALIDNYAWITK